MEAVAVVLALIYSRIHRGRRLFIVWVDLHTASPSLNRAILVRRMFACGIGLAYCRLVLTILDLTYGMPCIDKLCGEQFKETLGTREGAVESQPLFNIYISPLRQRLIDEHPRLCRMCNVIVALILYADDAALPADSTEDLQLAVDIFERFCNENRLYIAVPKTYVTVFHGERDTGVCYEGNKAWVDGKPVVVTIYGQGIEATATFKYLGVVIDSHGSIKAHLHARLLAFTRAINLLLAGLVRIPSYTHAFMIYLWNTLVAPVISYGMEQFDWTEGELAPLVKEESAAWRKLLRVGSRAPIDAAASLLGIDTLVIALRARRAAHFLRLYNAPHDSLQYAALLEHFNLQTSWLTAALDDVRLAFPGVRVEPVCNEIHCQLQQTRFGPTGDALNALSPHMRTPLSNGTVKTEILKIKNHIKRAASRITERLRKESKSAREIQIAERLVQNEYSKTSLLAIGLALRGEMHTALNCVGPIVHRSAISALLVGDWFLGRSAANYFAKDFIPSSRNGINAAADAKVQRERVCVHCWYNHHECYLEDAAHVLFDCARYNKERTEFFNALPGSFAERMLARRSSQEKMQELCGTEDFAAWSEFGRFAARVRQSRRKLKMDFQRKTNRLKSDGFLARSADWRAKGKFVCRHGVFFTSRVACQCLSANSSDERAWTQARYMPYLSEDLRALVVVPFRLEAYERLGILQARMRRRNW